MANQRHYIQPSLGHYPRAVLELFGMPITLHARAVQRASEVVGGDAKLADRLAVSRAMVRAWIAGAVTPPPKHFFKVVDILLEADPSFQLSPAEGTDSPTKKSD